MTFGESYVNMLAKLMIAPATERTSQRTMTTPVLHSRTKKIPKQIDLSTRDSGTTAASIQAYNLPPCSNDKESIHYCFSFIPLVSLLNNRV
jgi:hypothetical protein